MAIALLAVAVLIYGWCFRRRLFKNTPWLIVLAAGCLLLSVSFDLAHDLWPKQVEGQFGANAANYIEDGGKLEGIVLWACYLIRESAHQFLPSLTPFGEMAESSARVRI